MPVADDVYVDEPETYTEIETRTESSSRIIEATEAGTVITGSDVTAGGNSVTTGQGSVSVTTQSGTVVVGAGWRVGSARPGIEQRGHRRALTRAGGDLGSAREACGRALVGCNLGCELSATERNSEQLRPLWSAEFQRVRLDRSGWGPGGRRFKSCLPDSEPRSASSRPAPPRAVRVWL